MNAKKALSIAIVSAVQVATLSLFIAVARSYIASENDGVAERAASVLFGIDHVGVVIGGMFLLAIIYLIEGIASVVVLDCFTKTGKGARFFAPIPFVFFSVVFVIHFFFAVGF